MDESREWFNYHVLPGARLTEEFMQELKRKPMTMAEAERQSFILTWQIPARLTVERRMAPASEKSRAEMTRRFLEEINGPPRPAQPAAAAVDVAPTDTAPLPPVPDSPSSSNQWSLGSNPSFRGTPPPPAVLPRPGEQAAVSSNQTVARVIPPSDSPTTQALIRGEVPPSQRVTRGRTTPPRSPPTLVVEHRATPPPDDPVWQRARPAPSTETHTGVVGSGEIPVGDLPRDILDLPRERQDLFNQFRGAFVRAGVHGRMAQVRPPPTPPPSQPEWWDDVTRLVPEAVDIPKSMYPYIHQSWNKWKQGKHPVQPGEDRNEFFQNDIRILMKSMPPPTPRV